MLNVGMIAAVLALAHHVDPPILSLAFGVLLGGVGQLLVQVPDLRGIGLLVAPSRDLRHPALIARIARLLLPAVFGLAAVQVMVFVNTLLASLLPLGSISYLYYADRVMEFPLGVFGIALASASLPVMSRQAAARTRRGWPPRSTSRSGWPRTCRCPPPWGSCCSARRSCACSSSAADSGRRRRRPPRRAVWYAVGLAGFAGARIAAQAFYALGAAGHRRARGASSRSPSTSWPRGADAADAGTPASPARRRSALT